MNVRFIAGFDPRDYGNLSNLEPVPYSWCIKHLGRTAKNDGYECDAYICLGDEQQPEYHLVLRDGKPADEMQISHRGKPVTNVGNQVFGILYHAFTRCIAAENESDR